MELSKICAIFAAFTGMTPEEALEQLPLMHLAVEELSGQLRPGVRPEEHSQVLNYAAAALAFYRYSVLAANTGSIGSLRAGNVTLDVDSGASIRAAAEVRDEFVRLAAPLLNETSFLFHAV